MATTTDSTGSEHHRAQAAASVVKSALLDIVILTEDATNPDLGGWSTEMVTKLRQNVTLIKLEMGSLAHHPNLLFDTQGITNSINNLRYSVESNTQMSRRLSPIVASLTSSLKEYLDIPIPTAITPTRETENSAHESSAGVVSNAAANAPRGGEAAGAESSYKPSVENEKSPETYGRFASEQNTTISKFRPAVTVLPLKRKQPPDNEDVPRRPAPPAVTMSPRDSAHKSATQDSSGTPRSGFMGVFPPPLHTIRSINPTPELGSSQPSAYPGRADPPPIRALGDFVPTSSLSEASHYIPPSSNTALVTLAKFLASASVLPTVENQRRALFLHFNARLALLDREINTNIGEMLSEGKILADILNCQHELVQGEELVRFHMATEMFLKVFDDDATETHSVSPALSELRELITRLCSMVDN